MPLSSLVDWVRSKLGGSNSDPKDHAPSKAASQANASLKANAEKALHMKQAAEADHHIPPHQTAHEGMQPAHDPHMSDATRGREAGFTPQLKRSKVARSGDAS